MSAADMKERVEEMINRVYADLPVEVRNAMIAAEFASIDARTVRRQS